MSSDGQTSLAPHRVAAGTTTPRRDVLRGCVDRQSRESSGGNPVVLVVESSEDGNGNQFREAVDVGWALGRDRGLATQALMWSSHVVVLLDELPE